MSTKRWWSVGSVVLALGVLGACGDDAKKDNPDAGGGGQSCSLDKPCGDGQVCLAGVCTAGNSLHVVVDAKARGCQVAFADASDAKLISASFGKDVSGSFVHRAPKLGLSFISKQDASIDAAQVLVLVAGDGMPKVTRSSCVDAAGKVIKDAAFSLAD